MLMILNTPRYYGDIDLSNSTGVVVYDAHGLFTFNMDAVSYLMILSKVFATWHADVHCCFFAGRLHIVRQISLFFF